jgi:hypothetical protein
MYDLAQINQPHLRRCLPIGLFAKIFNDPLFAWFGDPVRRAAPLLGVAAPAARQSRIFHLSVHWVTRVTTSSGLNGPSCWRCGAEALGVAVCGYPAAELKRRLVSICLRHRTSSIPSLVRVNLVVVRSTTAADATRRHTLNPPVSPYAQGVSSTAERTLNLARNAPADYKFKA